MKSNRSFSCNMLTISLTRHVMAYPETRIDDDIQYAEYQNINKVFKARTIHHLRPSTSVASVSAPSPNVMPGRRIKIKMALQNKDSFSWMFNRTYLPKAGDPEYACVYANVTKLHGTGNYVFMQGWTTENNVTVEIPLFVKTNRTPGVGYIRTEDNAMHVTLKFGNGTEKSFGLYKLIYSDYKSCDILRVMSRYPACELYLHRRSLDKGVPRECMSIYKYACGREDNYHYPVYNSTCKTK
uniref:Putative salivary lipocalin n=1 Tax=Ixodes ricinus TaxID=34613 RepID=A0A0K8RM55_IXORI